GRLGEVARHAEGSIAPDRQQRPARVGRFIRPPHQQSRTGRRDPLLLAPGARTRRQDGFGGGPGGAYDAGRQAAITGGYGQVELQGAGTSRREVSPRAVQEIATVPSFALWLTPLGTTGSAPAAVIFRTTGSASSLSSRS